MIITSFKYLVIIFITAGIVFSQDSLREEKKKTVLKVLTVLTIDNLKDRVLTKNNIYKSPEDKESYRDFIQSLQLKFYNGKKTENKFFDLFSTVGNNISFGGIWNDCAVINFTPQMYIRPFSFINIYANHNVNCLIPLGSIKEYYQSVLFRAAAILIVDKSINTFLNSGSWVTDVISFAAKNVVINFLIKPFIEKSKTNSPPMQQFDNYYYSMSISF